MCNVLCPYCTFRKLNIGILSSQVCSWCPISVICRASFCTGTFVLDVIGYLNNRTATPEYIIISSLEIARQRSKDGRVLKLRFDTMSRFNRFFAFEIPLSYYLRLPKTPAVTQHIVSFVFLSQKIFCSICTYFLRLSADSPPISCKDIPKICQGSGLIWWMIPSAADANNNLVNWVILHADQSHWEHRVDISHCNWLGINGKLFLVRSQ